MGEETFGFATTLLGICSRRIRPHTFRISAEKVSHDITSGLHGHHRYPHYALNYRLCAALQQMGCGYTDGGTLAGFLDLPVNADSLRNGMKKVEQILGSVQIQKREESELDSVADEINATKEHDNYEEHGCTMNGHEHPPLPMLNGTYG